MKIILWNKPLEIGLCNKAIASKKDQAIEDAYNQIIEIAENVGFSVEQLLEFGAQKRKKTTRKSDRKSVV